MQAVRIEMYFCIVARATQVLTDMERFYAETGDEAWKPAKLLTNLVKEGKTLASLG